LHELEQAASSGGSIPLLLRVCTDLFKPGLDVEFASVSAPPFPIGIDADVPRNGKHPRHDRFSETIAGSGFVNSEPALLKQVLEVGSPERSRIEVTGQSTVEESYQLVCGIAIALLIAKHDLFEELGICFEGTERVTACLERFATRAAEVTVPRKFICTVTFAELEANCIVNVWLTHNPRTKRSRRSPTNTDRNTAKKKALRKPIGSRPNRT